MTDTVLLRWLLPLLLAVSLAPPIAGAQQLALAPHGLRAVDGDTLATRVERYRIIGLDAPETTYAKCSAEKLLGLKAKQRLAELISVGHRVTVRAPDGDAPYSRVRDRYGRKLVNVWSDGRNVATIMIGEGLARSYSGGRRKGWC